ncbi:hypothetical protein QBC39DRAFT_101331 [Podospora conica]|nr:hypothetical protein QBC39DRAFT_101331 [Schizothecium conicum]
MGAVGVAENEIRGRNASRRDDESRRCLSGLIGLISYHDQERPSCPRQQTRLPRSTTSHTLPSPLSDNCLHAANPITIETVRSRPEFPIPVCPFTTCSVPSPNPQLGLVQRFRLSVLSPDRFREHPVHSSSVLLPFYDKGIDCALPTPWRVGLPRASRATLPARPTHDVRPDPMRPLDHGSSAGPSIHMDAPSPPGFSRTG